MSRHGRMPTCPCLLLIPVALLVSTCFQADPARSDPAPPAAAGVELKLPADILYQRLVGPDSAVVFRHTTHVEMAGRKCTGCHPSPFRILSPTHRVDHRQMNAGGACAVCHDGKAAFGVRDAASCLTCHSGRPGAQTVTSGPPGKAGGATPSGGGPKPIVYARAESSPAPVTFRHESHSRDGRKCTACHPKPFRMKALAAPSSAMHESGACGACHDGKTSFGIDADDACARCHVEAKGTP